MLALVQPKPRGGASCFIAKELANPCALRAGTWLRSSRHKIYYVANDMGELYEASNELTCFGEQLWGGQSAPADLWCDGTKTPWCAHCISTPLEHNKGMGAMKCSDLKDKVVRVCQFETAQLECGEGQVIGIQEGSYGRWSKEYCGTPSVDTLTTDEMCGQIGNVHDAVMQMCDGKSVCTIDATDDRFGDQDCVSTYKYAEVRYTCQSPGGAGRTQSATDHVN